tara:strand:- start:224 stop:403 length:180 start_codon:yes stop_codon:yes gene_type:complete
VVEVVIILELVVQVDLAVEEDLQLKLVEQEIHLQQLQHKVLMVEQETHLVVVEVVELLK